MVPVEHDLLAEPRDRGSKLLDGGSVTEAAVDGFLDKDAQPVDFRSQHVRLCVAVDQAVLAFADQRSGDPVARGDIVEILPWYAGCLGACRGGDGGHGARHVKQERRLAENFVPAYPVQKQSLARKDLD